MAYTIWLQEMRVFEFAAKTQFLCMVFLNLLKIMFYKINVPQVLLPCLRTPMGKDGIDTLTLLAAAQCSTVGVHEYLRILQMLLEHHKVQYSTVVTGYTRVPPYLQMPPNNSTRYSTVQREHTSTPRYSRSRQNPTSQSTVQWLIF